MVKRWAALFTQSPACGLLHLRIGTLCSLPQVRLCLGRLATPDQQDP